MQVVIKPGMSLMGVQGTPDRRVLRLNRREVDALRRAAVIANNARELLADGNEAASYYDAAGEFASLAMRAEELADLTEFRII